MDFRPSVISIVDALRDIVAEYPGVLAVIDKLDECGQEHHHNSLKEIFGLQVIHPIHLLATFDCDPMTTKIYNRQTRYARVFGMPHVLGLIFY